MFDFLKAILARAKARRASPKCDCRHPALDHYYGTGACRGEDDNGGMLFSDISRCPCQEFREPEEQP